MNTRRDFIKKTAIGAAGITLGGLSAKSYGRVLGANDRINFGVAGINSRGIALMHAINNAKNTSIGAVCDVDRRIIEKSVKRGQDLTGVKPKSYEDVREMLEQKDIDAIAIATPDHWHAPMTIMGVQAGKHVYVEKPCSHNPREGELLVEAEKKYDKVIQMGNQQRSAPTSIQAIKDIREGIIGDVYMGKAWYANKREPIGK
ncbi:MAG: Gfo/Idh/MocA family protein, partial [Bacteroidota bacterium]